MLLSKQYIRQVIIFSYEITILKIPTFNKDIQFLLQNCFDPHPIIRLSRTVEVFEMAHERIRLSRTVEIVEMADGR
jgi:hypothetical protein